MRIVVDIYATGIKDEPIIWVTKVSVVVEFRKMTATAGQITDDHHCRSGILVAAALRTVRRLTGGYRGFSAYMALGPTFWDFAKFHRWKFWCFLGFWGLPASEFC